MEKKAPGKAVWITGLPGSGKSAVSEALRKRIDGLVVLRMDDLRKIATPNPTYSEAERDVLYRSLCYAALLVSSLGHDVAVDATGNLRRWRELARGLIPRYAEVYLKCPLEVCAEREMKRGEAWGAPRDIYKKAKEGWPVPGINAPYEEPLNPELVIDTERTGVEEAAELVEEILREK
ncbi:MAG: adenylyl-sulfate kinase [Nitrospiraceae bacterium]|nr:adenylyl-sulfate kinase [Nitrospiraceae bacterium]